MTKRQEKNGWVLRELRDCIYEKLIVSIPNEYKRKKEKYGTSKWI